MLTISSISILYMKVLSIILVITMHWLSRIVSWLICILVLVAGVALSVVLWHAYYKMRHKSEEQVQLSYLDQFVRNEQAVLVLAVLATIAVVIFHFTLNNYIHLSSCIHISNASICILIIYF